MLVGLFCLLVGLFCVSRSLLSVSRSLLCVSRSVLCVSRSSGQCLRRALHGLQCVGGLSGLREEAVVPI